MFKTQKFEAVWCRSVNEVNVHFIYLAKIELAFPPTRWASRTAQWRDYICNNCDNFRNFLLDVHGLCLRRLLSPAEASSTGEAFQIMVCISFFSSAAWTGTRAETVSCSSLTCRPLSHRVWTGTPVRPPSSWERWEIYYPLMQEPLDTPPKTPAVHCWLMSCFAWNPWIIFFKRRFPSLATVLVWFHSLGEVDKVLRVQPNKEITVFLSSSSFYFLLDVNQNEVMVESLSQPYLVLSTFLWQGSSKLCCGFFFFFYFYNLLIQKF